MDEQIKGKVEHFFRKYKLVPFDRKSTLIEAYQEPEGLYFLSSGIVRQYTITKNGEEVSLNVFKAPSIFPVSWILSDVVPAQIYDAQTPANVWIAPKNDSKKFLVENPDVVLDLIKRIYKGLDGYYLRMGEIMRGSASSRLIAELLIYARRFGKSRQEGIVLPKITERILASLTGLSRETVSRQLQILKKNGKLKHNTNGFIIPDITQLEEVLHM